jgi:hypothetical protein
MLLAWVNETPAIPTESMRRDELTAFRFIPDKVESILNRIILKALKSFGKGEK